MKKLIILSTQRSGSTMVCDDIAGTDQLGRPSEYFIKVIDSISVLDPEALKKMIFEAIEKGKTSNGVASIKVMSNQIKPIGRALSLAGLSKSERPEESFYEYFQNSKFLRIVRNDKIAQAISRVMAQQTDIYHTADNTKGMDGMLGKVAKSRDETKLHYNQYEIKKAVECIWQEELNIDAFLSEFKVPCRYVQYEESVLDRTYVYGIAKDFDIDVDSIQLGERRLKKISGNVSEEWAKRFRKALSHEKC